MVASHYSLPPLYCGDELSDSQRQFVDSLSFSRTVAIPTGRYLKFEDDVLSLVEANTKYKPLCVDFLAGKNRHRQQFGGGKSQLIAKAVGVSSKFKPSVLDMTAGLGGDAFALASLGCPLHLLERNPVVAALLADGVRRLNQAEPASVAMYFEYADSLQHLPASADVVYLDPMYPETGSKAAVNKAMTIFKSLVGKDEDAAGLLEKARGVANYRVVVKRPKQGIYLSDKEPTYTLSGKSSRFDVYVNKAMPKG